MKATYIMIRRTVVASLMLLPGIGAIAQLNPLGSIYYQNQYLANPAMSGLSDGVKLNFGYRQQPITIQGAPTTQYLTGEYRFSDRAGTALYIYNDAAGLLRRTKLMATYSYHLPLNADNRKLHFGLTGGFMSEKLDMDKLNGDVDDPSVARFNDRGMYFDGDFGVAYSDDKLVIQATFPNMRASFNKDETNVVDRSTFFAAVSYSLVVNEANKISLEPKVCVRGVKGHDHIIDVGANAIFLESKLNFFTMYHSSRNVTLGVGAKLMEIVTVTGMYTSQSSQTQSYANGNFEIGLKVSLRNSK